MHYTEQTDWHSGRYTARHLPCTGANSGSKRWSFQWQKLKIGTWPRAVIYEYIHSTRYMLLISIVFDVDSSAYKFEETCMICIDHQKSSIWFILYLRLRSTLTALLQIYFLGTLTEALRLEQTKTTKCNISRSNHHSAQSRGWGPRRTIQGRQPTVPWNLSSHNIPFSAYWEIISYR